MVALSTNLHHMITKHSPSATLLLLCRLHWNKLLLVWYFFDPECRLMIKWRNQGLRWEGGSGSECRRTAFHQRVASPNVSGVKQIESWRVGLDGRNLGCSPLPPLLTVIFLTSCSQDQKKNQLNQRLFIGPLFMLLSLSSTCSASQRMPWMERWDVGRKQRWDTKLHPLPEIQLWAFVTATI